MSPVYDILHVFTQPVTAFMSQTGNATGELQHATEEQENLYYWKGVIHGYFESDGMGDFTNSMDWGDVFMLTSQADKTTNGLYMVLGPCDAGASSKQMHFLLHTPRCSSVSEAVTRHLTSCVFAACRSSCREYSRRTVLVTRAAA